MADSEKYMESLSAFLDGELSPEEKAELYANTDLYPDSERILQAFKAISDETFGDFEPAPPELLTGVMLKVEALNSGKRKKRRGPLNTIGRVAGLAACAALIIFGATRFLPGMGGMGGESADTAAAPQDAPAAAEEAAPAAPALESVADAGAAAGENYKDAEAEMDAVTEESAPESTEAGEPQEAEAAAEEPMVYLMGLEDRSLESNTSSYSADDLSVKLEEMFTTGGLSLYDGAPAYEDILSGAAPPIFTYPGGEAAPELRSFLGNVLATSLESAQVAGGPIMTVYLAGDSASFLTVWAGEEGLICLLSDSAGDLIFSTDGGPELLTGFLSELKLLATP